MSKPLEITEYVGVYPLCIHGGLVIVSIDDASCTCYSGFDFGNGLEDARRTHIQYSASGRAFVRRYGRRYYLSEIERLGGVTT